MWAILKELIVQLKSNNAPIIVLVTEFVTQEQAYVLAILILSVLIVPWKLNNVPITAPIKVSAIFPLGSANVMKVSLVWIVL